MADDEMKRQMALFRFLLIAPAVAWTFPKASKMDYFRETCTKEHLLPNGKLVRFSPLTLKKWYLKYTDGGLEALVPKARIDPWPFQGTARRHLPPDLRLPGTVPLYHREKDL